jgi:hypothetical protein
MHDACMVGYVDLVLGRSLKDGGQWPALCFPFSSHPRDIVADFVVSCVACAATSVRREKIHRLRSLSVLQLNSLTEFDLYRHRMSAR